MIESRDWEKKNTNQTNTGCMWYGKYQLDSHDEKGEPTICSKKPWRKSHSMGVSDRNSKRMPFIRAVRIVVGGL